jgi:HAD superfamily hydrolase (TIGR01509 family)
MQVAPDLIIFDCDGVLIDSEVLSCQCLSQLLKAHGADLSVEDVMRLFLGQSRTAMLDYFAQRGKPLPSDFSEILQAQVRETFTSQLKAIEGVSDILDHLETPYCVASSSDMARLGLSLELTGLSHYFTDRWFSSESVKAGKPAPDLFLHAAAVIGVPADRVLVIEDSLNGVLAAKAAGMTVWGFVGGSHHRILPNAPALQAAGADRIVQSMPELAKAMRGLTV